MSRIQLALVFISVIVGMAVSGRAVASESTAKGASDYRSWTFKDFGIGADLFRPKPVGFDKPTVVYQLPRSAYEGDASWWILHLHLTVDINSRSKPGSTALIGAGANQVGTAYIRLNSARKNGHDVIVWTEDGILNGVVSHVARSTHLDIWFSDYIPISGVRPGRNELAFMVEQENLVRQLVIMPDSSIEHTRLAPAQIDLSERISRTHIAVGELVRARATISNVGGNVAKRVQIAVDSVPGAIAVIGVDKRVIGSLKPGRVVMASFLLRASRVGYFPIGISVSSSSNQRAALRYVTVSASPVARSTRAARPTHSSHVFGAVLSAIVALLGLLALFSGMRLTTLAPWGAGFLGGALAFAFWYLVIDARLAWSISVAAASLAVSVLLARVAAPRIKNGGALVFAFLCVSALALILNVVVLVVLLVVANA